jgi:glycosyltransferase involved in cell wall biosynthesis
MRVLLIATDLYRDVGGGQTVYKRIIESAPHVQFFYYRENEREDAPRPPNAIAVRLAARLKLKVLSAPPFPGYKRTHLQDADRFARSVAGQHFDIVDIPDFFSFGSLLRDAFEHHHVQAERIVLAMHGNISVSLEMAWGSAGDNVLEQRLLERQQFEEADGAYAISPRYIREWQAEVNRPVQYIDPLAFVDVPESAPEEWSNEILKPNLYCIGRTERRKGNDLFVEIVRWLDPATYGKAAHIGDEVISSWGVGTRAILHEIARKRDASLEYFPSFTRNELKALFRSPSLVILPVRYDTLNLVALEALFEGCPVAVSSEAGVCDYLDSTHPGLPYVKIAFGDFYGAVQAINDLLGDYNEYRRVLRSRLEQALPRARRALDIGSIYREILDGQSTAVRMPGTPIQYYESGLTPGARAGRIAKRLLPIETYRALERVARSPGKYFVRKLKESEYFGDARYLAVVADSKDVPARLKRIAEHSEYNKLRLGEKLNEIYGACSNPLYRCNFWLDIARIERILQNELVAVTYELRALRLVGWDAFGILPRVVAALRSKGLTHEADAAEALYADPASAPGRVRALLNERYRENLHKSELPYEYIEDRRTNSCPRVAVIVSLYKAAAKLPVFLTTLRQQTLVRRGSVEVILIDSGSPDCEKDVILRYWEVTGMNAVYARSERRETIQAAWNRGIMLSTAPYLVFLGVDETLYPDALDYLANELDNNPSADWVMANSLVTAVDEHGVYKNDVMPYDRGGGSKNHTYLETCYLSWVGGMYRKSIHERFGYYDESFGAAGDTEFKNRILPHIEVKFVPRTLGLFLNYPDERTTASPRAEIEDLRAWYIHRTPGGIDYAFADRPTEDVARLLEASLGYRKSYCQHVSADIEYATYLSDHLHKRQRLNGYLSMQLHVLLGDLQRMEYTPSPRNWFQCQSQLVSSWRHARDLRGNNYSGSEIDRSVGQHYKVLNDNRFEQHSWLWKTT